MRIGHGSNSYIYPMAACMTDESRFKCIRTTIARSDSIRDYQYAKTYLCDELGSM